MPVSLPPLFRSPGFALFWLGVALSATGMRATAAANLWVIHELTGSTFAVGLVGIFELLATLALAPIGGSMVDRADRRRVLQVAQSAAMVSSLALAVLTLTGLIAPAWIYLASAIVAAAAAFETPARHSLVPSLVPPQRLFEAYSLLHPAQQVARLVGPALAGVLIAVWGAGTVYVLDAMTYTILVVTLPLIPFRWMTPVEPRPLFSGIADGFAYVRGRTVLSLLIAFDLTGTVFAGFRVLLPALARDVFLVGPAGYGLLSAAPAVGAILGAGTIYRLRRIPYAVRLAGGAAMAYGLSVMALGAAPVFALAMVGAAAGGYFDAVGATLRHTVLQMETPDPLRGRVTSTYVFFSRGGVAFGQAQIGALGAVLGAPVALGVGGATAFFVAAVLSARGVRGPAASPAVEGTAL